MIVLDASVVLEMLLTRNGPSLAKRVLDRRHALGCPELLDLEVLQVLRRYVRSKAVSVRRANQALQDLEDLPLTRYRHGPLVKRIWQLRQDLSAYDSAYVALAELLGATLLTRDSRLARAPGHRAVVELT